MDGGRPKVVWPFLLVLAGLFVLVATMPRDWQSVARDPAAKQSLSKAWDDLHISPRRCASARDGSGEVPESFVARFRIASAAEQEAPSGTSRWVPAATSAKLATRPIADRAPKIDLPGLPPKVGEPISEGPLIAPLNVVERLPEATSVVGPIPEEAWCGQRVARRSTRPVGPTSDARDRWPTAFSSATSGQGSGQGADSIWCPPESLYGQLAPLTEDKRTAVWAEQTQGEVRRLGEIVDDRPNLVPAICARLRKSVDRADRLAARLKDPALAADVRRAGYALRRRLDIWERVLPPMDCLSNTPEVDLSRFRLALSEVDGLIADSSHGRAWREYLLLDALQEASKATDAAGTVWRKALARRVLGRVALASLTDSQQRFVASEPLGRLAAELRRMASAPPECACLLAALERYEQTGLASDARRVADECLWVGLRPKSRLEDWRRHMAAHYRNANLRMVLSRDLLNRLMPERLPEYEQVRDTILGKPVRGESLTATEVGIRLIPNRHRVRLALEITGEVAALTSSSEGPAVFHNASESHYAARKPMELTVDGLTLWPAEVKEVHNRTRLRRLRTAFDEIPLVGALIQNVARTQHDMKRSDVRRAVERKVAARAKQRIDDEADSRLGRFSEKLEQRVLEPMQGMSLGPRMIQAKTTQDRLTMRLRVASPRQLGAHTPRPMAPKGSLASFQVHQTAMNNMIEQLALDGKTFTVAELRCRLAERLKWPELKQRSTSDDEVTITFAEKDAVRLTCRDGRITIDLAIARLRKSPRTWRDFQVRAHYRPRVEGLSAELVRDGVVQLPGRRVRTSSQVALRTVFSKLFSKNRTRQIVPDRLRNHPKMGDLAVTQMVIEDGWIAVALGPKPRLARAAADRQK